MSLTPDNRTPRIFISSWYVLMCLFLLAISVTSYRLMCFKRYQEQAILQAMCGQDLTPAVKDASRMFPMDVYTGLLESLSMGRVGQLDDDAIVSLCIHSANGHYTRVAPNSYRFENSAQDLIRFAESFQHIDSQLDANIAWALITVAGPQRAYDWYRNIIPSNETSETLVTRLCLATANDDSDVVQRMLSTLMEDNPRFLFSVIGQRYSSAHPSLFMKAVREATSRLEVRRRVPIVQDGSIKSTASLAVLYLYSGRLAEAEAAVRFALSELPDLSGAWLTLAEIEAARGHDARKINDDIRRLQMLDPGDPIAYEVNRTANQRQVDLVALHGQEVMSAHAAQVKRLYHPRYILRNDVYPQALVYLDTFEPSEVIFLAERSDVSR
jgi:hypothetical protein